MTYLNIQPTAVTGLASFPSWVQQIVQDLVVHLKVGTLHQELLLVASRELGLLATVTATIISTVAYKATGTPADVQPRGQTALDSSSE